MTVRPHGDESEVRVDDGPAVRGRVVESGDRTAVVVVDGVARRFPARTASDAVSIGQAGAVFTLGVHRRAHGPVEAQDATPHLDSPMPGTVVLTPVTDGAHVAAGDAVIVVEAMKMEHVIRSSVAGTVSLRALVGDQVARGQTLAVIEPHETDAAGD